MTKAISKSQIDRLGERLKKGKIEETDIQLLGWYRRSFAEASEEVVGLIRNELGLEPTVRPEKSRESIVDKLCRESIRLSQIRTSLVAGLSWQTLPVRTPPSNRSITCLKR